MVWLFRRPRKIGAVGIPVRTIWKQCPIFNIIPICFFAGIWIIWHLLFVNNGPFGLYSAKCWQWRHQWWHRVREVVREVWCGGSVNLITRFDKYDAMLLHAVITVAPGQACKRDLRGSTVLQTVMPDEICHACVEPIGPSTWSKDQLWRSTISRY